MSDDDVKAEGWCACWQSCGGVGVPTVEVDRVELCIECAGREVVTA